MTIISSGTTIKQDNLSEEFKSIISSIGVFSKIGYARFNPKTLDGYATETWFKNLDEISNQDIANVALVYNKVHQQDKDAILSFYHNSTRGGENQFDAQIRIVSPLGKIKWIRIFISVTETEDGQFEATEINSDITDLKNKESDLIKERDNAVKQSVQKSSFITNISHEIRTPLNAIVGFSNMLQYTNEEKEKQSYIDIINSNTNMLLKLIGDIIDISRIETNTFNLEYSNVDINQMMYEIEQLSKFRLPDSSISLSFEDRLPECNIYIDRERLMQVITNLINNAIKSTEVGRIEFGYRLKRDNSLYFYVTDTGRGLKQEEAEHIFERFAKTDSVTPKAGLELSICKMLVECFGGTIDVTSEINKGSTFFFTIPTGIKQTKTSSEYIIDRTFEKPESAKPAPQIENEDKHTILIAEDIFSNFKLLQVMLKGKYNILRAKDGLETIEMYRKHKPNLILMDIKMPKMDGIEATRVIKLEDSEMPIIAVTANAFESEKRNVLNSGFDDYIAKPVFSGILMKKIHKLIRPNN